MTARSHQAPIIHICHIVARFAFALLVSGSAAAGTPAAIVRWPAVAGAKGYHIEIARDRAFDQVLAKESTDRPGFDWHGAEPGIYYFHVAVVDNGGAVSAFSNTAVLRVLPEAPELVSPGDDDEVELSKEGMATLRWKAVKKARSYRLQVAREASFARIVFDRSLPQLDAIVGPLDEGKHYWRVTVIGEHALESLPSRTFSFDASTGAKVEAPSLFAPDGDAEIATGEVEFRWEATPSAKATLAVAKDKGFRQLIASRDAHADKRSEHATKVKLEPGRYFWRAGNLPPRSSSPVWSEARVLIVKTPPPPGPPALVAPAANATLDRDLELKWRLVPKAEGYEVEIDDEAARRTQSTSLKYRASPGDHTWRVRVVGGIWSEARRFKVEPPQAPKKDPPSVPPSTEAGVGAPGFAFGIGQGSTSGSLVSESDGVIAEVEGELATTTSLRVATGADSTLGLALGASRAQQLVGNSVCNAAHLTLRVQRPFGPVAPYLGVGYAIAERIYLPNTGDGWTEPTKTRISAPRGSLGLALGLGSRLLAELDASIEFGNSRRLTVDGVLFLRILSGLSLGIGSAFVNGSLQLDGPSGKTVLKEKSLSSAAYLGWVLQMRPKAR